LPLGRIAILGASVSAGFGGTPFRDAFVEAAPRSAVESHADLMLFRDPMGNAKAQIDAAIAFKPTTVIALDLLFWSVYSRPYDDWQATALASMLADLDRVLASGAWVLVGDVPRITTASELLLSRDNVPSTEELAAWNGKIAAWARTRDHVRVIPFASWAEPLASGGMIEIAPGHQVSATSLVGPDGLHPNALGVWALLDRLDHWIEAQLPGTARDALVFARPR
jgi:hypothetical protein